MTITNRHLVPVVLSALFLMGADGASDPENDRAMLIEQHRQLTMRIEALKVEQDFLIFQKECYAMDSKYLVLDIGAGTGQLKYKNRTLKTFGLSKSSRVHFSAPSGRLQLTEKTDGSGNRYGLVFGKALIMEPKGAPFLRGGKQTFHVLIGKKDFMPLYYVLEKGALAYVKQDAKGREARFRVD